MNTTSIKDLSNVELVKEYKQAKKNFIQAIEGTPEEIEADTIVAELFAEIKDRDLDLRDYQEEENNNKCNMLENIKLNEKYTLIIENTVGMMVHRHVRINKAEEVLKDSYGYNKDKCLQLIYTLKGKRKKTGTKFKDNKIAIVEGWQEIKETINSENFRKMLSFGENNFDKTLEINNLNPIVKYNC